MQLKRLQDIEWIDLPKLESPFFAHQWVLSSVNLNDFGMLGITGLDDVIWDGHDHHRYVLDEHAYKCLLKRVQNAEVFLVHNASNEAVSPLLLRDESHRNEWKASDALTHEQRFNVEWMLGYAVQTKGIWSPVVESAAETTSREPLKKEEPEPLTVTNPQWEHVDQERADDTPEATIVGDTVLLKVDVTGAADGTRISFRIVDTAKSPPSRVGVARGTVEGGIGSAEWTVRTRNKKAKLQFEGEVRRVASEMTDIPIIKEFHFSI